MKFTIRRDPRQGNTTDWDQASLSAGTSSINDMRHWSHTSQPSPSPEIIENETWEAEGGYSLQLDQREEALM